MEPLESLLERTLAGDLEAFGEVVARFQDMAVGYAYSVLGDFHEAQDAAQEAFITAYSNLADLRDRGRFPGWFRRIVLSACRVIARRRRPTLPLEEAETAALPTGDPARVVEREEMKDAVLAAIGSLSAPNRAATVLYYINGYSVAEVAEFLQVPAGTVKRRLHDSRKQLKARMMGMVEKSLHGQRPPPEFRVEVLKRIGHWERLRASDEEKVEMVMADPEWVRLVEAEIELEPMSLASSEIRRRIACMEACHQHYIENVRAILEMIGAMKPAPILDCGQADAERREEAKAYAEALATWRNADAIPHDADERTREVFTLLGERTDGKVRLVAHLIGRLNDDAYRVYPDEDEDFELTESRIQHLAICNYNWRQNLRIVLREIAAGRRLFDWHVPDGYNAHGDVPDRVARLRDLVAPVAAWVEGRAERAGRWSRLLGEATAEKRWLAASLCKHVSEQHKEHDAERALARPSL